MRPRRSSLAAAAAATIIVLLAIINGKTRGKTPRIRNPSYLSFLGQTTALALPGDGHPRRFSLFPFFMDIPDSAFYTDDSSMVPSSEDTGLEVRPSRSDDWMFRAGKRSSSNLGEEKRSVADTNWQFRTGKRNNNWQFRTGKRNNNWQFRTGKRMDDELWKLRSGKRDEMWKFRGGK